MTLNKDNPVKRKRGRPRKQELTTIEVRADALSGFNGNSIVIAEALKDDLWEIPAMNFGPLADFEEPKEVKKEKARHKRFQQEQQEIHMALLAWARAEEKAKREAHDKLIFSSLEIIDSALPLDRQQLIGYTWQDYHREKEAERRKEV
jgi:hypothetical protein